MKRTGFLGSVVGAAIATVLPVGELFKPKTIAADEPLVALVGVASSGPEFPTMLAELMQRNYLERSFETYLSGRTIMYKSDIDNGVSRS